MSVSNPFDKFNEYLKNARISDKTGVFTHSSLNPQGKYFIGEAEEHDFFTLYCNCVKKLGTVKKYPTITEKPVSCSPLRVDVDLKSEIDGGIDRKYDENIIKKIVSYYQREIENAVDPNSFDKKQLWCVVLEKKAPRIENGIVKDGFHLHFPYFICNAWLQDEYMRKNVIEKMKKDGIWEGLGYLDSPDKYIDKIASKTWLMYGSAKNTNMEPFLCTRIYNDKLKSININDAFTPAIETLRAVTGKPFTSNTEYYLPRLLSIRGKVSTELKQEIVQKEQKEYVKKKPKLVPKIRSEADVMKDLTEIREGRLLEMLSDNRVNEYTLWMDVGWTLFNIGQGCQEALELWILFSQRSDKFVDGECEKHWNKMEMRGKTIGSIHFMAKTDSPQQYKEWRDTCLKFIIRDSLFREKEPNEWEVSCVIHKMYEYRFVCANAKKELWYEFRDHRWHEMNDCLALKKLMAEDVTKQYYDLKVENIKKQKDADEGERKKLEVEESKITKMITALKQVNFQKKVLEMCKIKFYDGKFLARKDENRKLFGCANGVIDLEMMLFRDGRPDDYITLSSNVVYRNFSGDDDEVVRLERFFEEVFPNKNIRNYYLDLMCSALEGGNVNKIFAVCTGDGDNAKSVTFALMESVFGEYCIKFPRELLIVGRGNNSSGPRPELARVRGRRLAMTQEITKMETLAIGVLKELTGNDSFFARNLQEKGDDIKPMFLLMLQCNEPPKLPGHDQASWNRVRDIEFQSKFVHPSKAFKDPVPETREEQLKQKKFLADPFFKDKVDDLIPAVLWTLFNRFKEYKKNGLKEPEEVIIATNTYRSMNDVYLQFITDKIELCEGSFLTLTELYQEFTCWYSENHSSYKEKFDKLTIKHEFTKKFGAPEGTKNTGWKGYKITLEDAKNIKI